ncbi:IS3 family transposase [Metabacillus niabensis]|uniref:IS3 family transposase n=1 Tax=Metabacillus niabensis TaxID=324854 RepID=UPI0015826077
MYYGEKLVSYEDLKRKIEDYIYWYNNKRSKEKLTGLGPVKSVFNPAYQLHNKNSNF